jgi:septum formation protein
MLILASGSPRRAKILRDRGVEFTVVKSDAPEVSYPHDPERTVKENALAKGAAVGRARTPAAPQGILSADTIVWFDGKIYGKPRDLDEAKGYLRELSGNVHTVFTGVAYNGEVKVVRSDVKFRKLSDAMIAEYVARVKPTDRAGAYDIDESGDLIVESYTGSYENIMGLPVEPLKEWNIVR